MDDRFDWSDYPIGHVGPLAPPGAQLVENAPSCVDIDECAEVQDISESVKDDCGSDDESLLGSDGTDNPFYFSKFIILFDLERKTDFMRVLLDLTHKMVITYAFDIILTKIYPQKRRI